MNLNQYIQSPTQHTEAVAHDFDPVDIMSLESHIDHDTAVVDTALDTLEQIAHLTESMESAAGEMASSPVFYHNVQRQLEKLNSVMGLDAGEDGSVSMESADSESARAVSLEEAKEGLGAWIKKIWVAIRDTFRAIGRSIAELISKIFSGVDKEMAKLRAFKDVASINVEGDSLKIGNANVLGVNGKDLTVANIEDSMSDFIDLMDQVDKSYVEKITDVFNDGVKAMKNDTWEEYFNDWFGLVLGSAMKLSVKMTPQNLPGYYLAKATRKVWMFKEEAPIHVPIIERTPKGGDKNELKGVTGKELAALVETAIELGGKISANKEALKKMAKAREDAGVEIESFVKRVGSGKIKGAVQKVHLDSAIKVLNGLPVAFYSKSNSMIFSIIRAVRIVVDQAIKESKGSGEEGKKEGDDK